MIEKAFLVFCTSLLIYFSSSAQKLETVIQNGHLSVIKTVAHTPDGNYLLTGSRDKTIKLWEISTGREMRTFFGHTNTVNGLDVSDDGKTFVSSSADGKAMLWEIATGNMLKVFDMQDDFLTTVDLASNGKWLITAGFSQKAYLWDIQSGDTLRSFEVDADRGLGYGVISKFRADDKVVYFGNDNSTVTAYSTTTGELLFEFEREWGSCGGCATFVAVSENNLVTVSSGAPLALRNTVTGEITKILQKKTDDNRDVAITTKAQKIAHLTDDFFSVYNYQGDSLYSHLVDEQVNEIDFSPDGQYVVTVDNQKLVKRYNATTGDLIQSIGGYQAMLDKGGLDYDADRRWDYYIKKYTDLKNDFDVSPNGELLAKAKIGTVVRIWKVSSGQLVSELRGHEKAVLSVAFDKSGERLITGSADGTIKLWEVKTGKVISTFKGHRDVIFDVAFSNDGSKFISGSWDGTAKLWDVGSETMITNYPFDNSSPYKLEFYKSDIYALISSLDKSLNLYELDSKKTIRQFIGHTNVIHDFDFHQDRLASVSWDGTVKYWDITTGLQEWRHQHARPLYATAISADGSTTLAAGEERTIYAYDAKNGTELYSLTGHQATVTNLKFTENDTRLISSSEDGMIKIWDLKNQKELISYMVFGKNDWMAINDQGYFNSTEGAFDKVVFVKNMKTYGAGQFFNKFYQPDLLKNTFSGNSKSGNLENQLNESPPPTLEFLAPHSNETVKTATVDVLIKIEDAGGGAEKVLLKHNNKLVLETDLKLKNGKAIINYTINLINGTNTLEAVALNEANIESTKKSVTITKEGKFNTSLYVVAVGINHYENESLNLNYARADAEGFLKVIKDKSKALFDKVETIELMDEDATKEKIFERLNLLSKVIKPQDVLFFYYAGHGSMVEDNFYFVPTDNVKLYSEEKLKKNAISASEMQNKLREIAALKQLVIIDACQSGGSVELLAQRGAPEEKALAQLSRSTGIHVLAAAGSEQFATEFKALGHGLFTHVLLEALSGKADGAPKDGKVTILELRSYLDDQVPEYSKKYKGKMQFPHTFSRGQDFPIVVEK